MGSRMEEKEEQICSCKFCNSQVNDAFITVLSNRLGNFYCCPNCFVEKARIEGDKIKERNRL